MGRARVWREAEGSGVMRRSTPLVRHFLFKLYIIVHVKALDRRFWCYDDERVESCPSTRPNRELFSFDTTYNDAWIIIDSASILGILTARAILVMNVLRLMS